MKSYAENWISIMSVNRWTDEGVNEQIKTDQRKKGEFVYLVHKKQYRQIEKCLINTTTKYTKMRKAVQMNREI